MNNSFCNVIHKLNFRDNCHKYYDSKSSSFVDVLNILKDRVEIIMDEQYPCAIFTKSHFGLKQEMYRKAFYDSINVISDVYHYVASGQRYKALDVLYNHYFKDELAEEILEVIPEDTKLYRMRASNVYTIYGDEEMFHVPFEKSYRLSNQRYSISGFPSLYCSSSVYGCWIEMGMPQFEKANVALYAVKYPRISEIKNETDIPDKDVIVKCINVGIDSEKIQVTPSNLRWLLLFSICDLPVKEVKAPFKPEYVIPQLLLECVVRYIYEHKPDYILGIKYKSVKRDDEGLDFFGKKNIDLFDNYVFPPYNYKEYGVCDVLDKVFELKGKTSWFHINNIDANPVFKKHKVERTYDYSSFRKIELYLDSPQMLINFK